MAFPWDGSIWTLCLPNPLQGHVEVLTSPGHSQGQCSERNKSLGSRVSNLSLSQRATAQELYNHSINSLFYLVEQPQRPRAEASTTTSGSPCRTSSAWAKPATRIWRERSGNPGRRRTPNLRFNAQYVGLSGQARRCLKQINTVWSTTQRSLRSTCSLASFSEKNSI